MTIITTLKHLVQPTSTVEFPLTLATEQIIQNIFHTLANRSEAIGVAANQIGYDCRIFGMYVSGEIAIFINPAYECVNGGRVIVYTEGCLSFPGEKIKTKRFEKIVATAFDMEGNQIQMNLSGIESICFQHETDHCNGIVMHERQVGSNGIQSRKRCKVLRNVK